MRNENLDKMAEKKNLEKTDLTQFDVCAANCIPDWNCGTFIVKKIIKIPTISIIKVFVKELKKLFSLMLKLEQNVLKINLH